MASSEFSPFGAVELLRGGDALCRQCWWPTADCGDCTIVGLVRIVRNGKFHRVSWLGPATTNCGRAIPEPLFRRVRRTVAETPIREEATT